MLRLSNNARPAVFEVSALDESGRPRASSIAGEHALTLYLDKRELVTLMTLGAAPEYLVLGYLRNQRLVGSVDELAEIQVDWQTGSAAVTSRSLADTGVSCWERPALARRELKATVTTGCGQGTMYEDVMTDLDPIVLNSPLRLSQSVLYRLLDLLRRHESIYKVAGAVHGCALCALPSDSEPEPRVLSFVEDVGRHNAVDAIAGWMWQANIPGDDKVFYTTGRLTSEMVIKCAQMRIPVLISRSGLTQMGYELAQRLGMTLLGRCQGRHFLLYSGAQRFDFDPPARIEPAQITGLILAGGLGRRMSADGLGINKALQPYRGRALIDHVIDRLRPQVGEIVINANDRLEQFATRGSRVIADEHGGFQGPLAGLHAGLKACGTPWLLTAPCDSPYLPGDLVSRMAQAVSCERATIAVASCVGQWQPVFMLVHRTLLGSLGDYLAAGDRKIDRWLARVNAVVVEFEDTQAFLNFNTLEELRDHER